MIKFLFLILIGFFFGSCASKTPSLEDRIKSVFDYAKKENLKEEIINTTKFDIFSLQKEDFSCKNLNIYIEGDGLAFVNKNRISSNPTPINSVSQKLMQTDKSSCKIYLARPCQYYNSSSCNSSYWTNKRFSAEVLNSYDEVLTYIKNKYQNNTFTLIGHSGGGAIATILASYRDDINYLITVAGNLDIEKWIDIKNLTPLEGSLNPKDFTKKLEGKKQFHLVGNKDDVVPKEVFLSYYKSFEDKKSIQYKIIEANHSCCYENEFGFIVNEKKLLKY